MEERGFGFDFLPPRQVLKKGKPPDDAGEKAIFPVF